MNQTVAAVLIGLVAGLLSGLFGIGGGILMVPALVLAVKLPQHDAHATSLAAIVPIASAALIPFIGAGELLPLFALWLVVGSLSGAVVGARLMARLSPRRLRVTFGILMIVVAARMALGMEPEAVGLAATPVVSALAGIAIGLVAGTGSALFGIGGGLILVPALVLLLAVPQHLAQGTSLATIVPTALLGSLIHRRAGYVRLRTAVLLGASGIGGGLLGSQIALGLDSLILQRLFAVLLTVAVVKLLITEVRKPPDKKLA